MSLVPAILAAALVGAGLVAIVLQDHGGALPLGLLNEGREVHARLSAALLLGAVLALGVFGWEAVRRRRLRLGAWLRGLLASLVLLELGVTAIDLLLVSRSPTSRLGGPYWELRNRAGRWVFVKKGIANLGFRAAGSYALEPDRPRVLFLGDSYTEGSGSHFECNYPQVVQRELGRLLGHPVEVMNAGVGGYGPVDAANLLDLLLQRGYRFDALVFNLFLENDFTDNLPATERRVVAGINFRFPASTFLRHLHPLNSRTFRYGIFVTTAASLTVPEHDLVRRLEGPCRPVGEPLAELSPALRALVERRLEINYRRDGGRMAGSEVRRAVGRMRAAAEARGVPFALVVFPDRILVDPELRALLPLREEAYDLGRLMRWVQRELADHSIVDMTPALAGASAWYRVEDTHLSDAGNRRAGAFVAERLAAILELRHGAGEARGFPESGALSAAAASGGGPGERSR